MLLETRTNSLGRLLNALPNHCLKPGFSVSAPPQMQGRKGYGLAVLVRRDVADWCESWLVSTDIQAVWVRCEGALFGVQGQVMLGGTYIPPRGEGHKAEEIGESFAS